MRREGLHSFHHFADDDDQALVAMAIDAVDIAREPPSTRSSSPAT